mgnify:CR=1 FL=1
MVEQIKNIIDENSFITKNKTALLIAAKVFIAAGFLLYLISSIDFNEIINAAAQADVSLVVVASLLLIPNLYFQFYKWKITANVALAESSKSKIWLSLFYGLSAGVFTPARVGEYFGRAIVFKNKSLISVTLATLLDKIFLLLIVAFFGAISSILFIHFHYKAEFYLTLSLFMVVFSVFYFFLLMIFNDKFWNSLLFEKLKNSKKLEWLFNKIAVFRKLDREYAVKMLIISLLFYLCFLIQYALLVAAFSNNSNYWYYIWAGNLMMFAKTVIPPVSLGELGIREGASVYFLTILGESASVGFNASIFLFFINVLIPSLIGFILLMKKNDD